MNKFECMSAFIAVVEENGFAHAAKKLGVSTAAISRQITTLEGELGVNLLIRTTRKVALTEPGRTYYEQCKDILAKIDLAESLLTSSQQQASGQLYVLCNQYFAERHIIPRLQAFMHEHPLLTIRLELAERFPDFSKEEVDIALGISMEGPPGLVRRKITSTRYVLCASPLYLKTHGTPKSLQDLIKHDYITHVMRYPDNAIIFENNNEILVKPILWLNDTHAMCESAIAGLGIVRLHEYVVQEALRNGSLCEILTDFHQETIPVYLYYQKNRFLQPKIRRFIDYFITPNLDHF